MTNRGEQFTKRVDFKEADDERQIATGVVMVPDKVDLQGDFERPETIREMSEGFMTRLSGDGAAEGGVMHAAFPGHSTLVENTVLDQSREIGGEEVTAGSWVQSWKFDDSELWTLVRDDILSGYSIGAENVRWSDPMEQEELPDDVDVAAGYPDEEPAYELEQGRVVEVSSVDIPAVPDAQIIQTKDDSKKRVADYLGDREGFMEEMAERGHSEGEAERLWSYLQRAVDEEGQDVDDDDVDAGWLSRAKAYFSRGPGGSSADKDEGEFGADIFRVVAPEEDAENYDDDVLGIGVDFPNSAVYVDWRNEVFPDQLDDAHVSVYGSTSDLEQATGNTAEQMDTVNAKTAKAMFPGSADAVKNSEETDPAAGDGGTDDGGKDAADSMTDKDDEPPEWAKELQDSIETNSERIEQALEGDEEGGEKDADGEGGDDPMKDAPEWAKALAEQTEKNAERIDDVAMASGASQQLDGTGGGKQSNRKYSSAWDDTLGLPSGGDA